MFFGCICPLLQHRQPVFLIAENHGKPTHVAFPASEIDMRKRYGLRTLLANNITHDLCLLDPQFSEFFHPSPSF